MQSSLVPVYEAKERLPRDCVGSVLHTQYCNSTASLLKKVP